MWAFQRIDRLHLRRLFDLLNLQNHVAVLAFDGALLHIGTLARRPCMDASSRRWCR